MRIDDLLSPSLALVRYASLPEVDPLIEEDALQEAQVLDVRFDALSGVVGILFELRQALQLREASTGVLVAHGVRELKWSGPSRSGTLTAWSVGSSRPRVDGRAFELILSMWPPPGSRLSLTAENAMFFTGDVPGLSEAPTDYTARSRESIGNGVAGWCSSFEPISAVFLDPRLTASSRP
jgi:hypothetical protein